MTEVTYKTAKPGSLRAASTAVMHANAGKPAEAVIALIAALPGFDKGKARSHYYWCGKNGFAPFIDGKPTATPAPDLKTQLDNLPGTAEDAYGKPALPASPLKKAA